MSSPAGMAAPRPVIPGLTDLRVCAWPVASATVADVRAARGQAAQHPEPILTLETCQRVEVYSMAACDCAAPYRASGPDALVHLAEVAAGIHAAIPGEEQVMGQVRGAVAGAPQELRSLAAIAVGCARHLRRHASLAGDTGEVLDRALALTAQTPIGTSLVLGSGHVARLVTRRALTLGFDRVVVAARTDPTGDWNLPGAITFLPLAEVVSIDPVTLIAGCLGEGAGEFTPKALPSASLMVDLGTPRNFTPGHEARVVTIADILANEDGHARARREYLSLELARLVHERLERSERAHHSGLRDLRVEVEAVRKRELARIRRLHPEIPEQTAEVITRSLVNRLFHEPSRRLLEMEDPDLTNRFIEVFTPAPGAHGGGKRS